MTYVWLFSATGNEAENLANMVTKEFEEALGKAGCLPIVERRNYPDLESHQRQEKRIAGADLSPREKKELFSTTKANAVVFGEITDDIQGGQLKVAVTLETLTGVRLVDTSVRFTRGKRFDAEERERQMAELASVVCRKFARNGSGSNNSSGSGLGSDSGDGGNGSLGGMDVKKAQGYEFTLQGCSVSGSDIDCWITVRDTLQGRKLTVMGRSRLVDQKLADHYPVLLESDGSSGGSQFLWVKVPGKFGLRFKGLGEYVQEISRLDVVARAKGTSEFNFKWENV